MAAATIAAAITAIAAKSSAIGMAAVTAIATATCIAGLTRARAITDQQQHHEGDHERYLESGRDMHLVKL